MSKTDKDRPLWVQNLESGLIDHDHRSGECIIGDKASDRWNHNRHHRRVCKKKVTIEFECTKSEPYVTWRMDTRECWIMRRICNCPIPDSWKKEMHGCDGPIRNIKCVGHTRTEYDDSIPCVCDDFPPNATCVPAWTVGAYYTWGGVPSDFVRNNYHKPERARERKLRDYAREYNTYGELEDGDFVNHQARNSARWNYW